MSNESKHELEHLATMVLRALTEGRLQVPEDGSEPFQELVSARTDVWGIPDVTVLSDEAQAVIKAAGKALMHMGPSSAPTSDSPFDSDAAQAELFRLFSILFASITGFNYADIKREGDIQRIVIEHVKTQRENFVRGFNASLDELASFYDEYATRMFAHAKTFGGVKLVLGGQKQFRESALTGLRITSLYADTQLIPDPIHPFVSGDLNLNALPMHLAMSLYYLLQLKPFVDARLPTQPIYVFPSFEVQLEEGDIRTKRGIGELVFKVVSPVCDSSLSSFEELLDYADRMEDRFVNAVMAERLFVPPNSSPLQQYSFAEAKKIYFEENKGRLADSYLSGLERLTPARLAIHGLFQRLTPQYHLAENAFELTAQPLLTQDVHWHYFEKSAQASATDLVHKKILSEDAFRTLRALQDDQLGWLANVPISALVELTRNQEHKEFREELVKYTAQLYSAGPAELDEVVREVNHALADLVQRHQKNLRNLENKYDSTKWAAIGAGATTLIATCATTVMFPWLAPVAAPYAAATAAAATGALGGIAMAKTQEYLDKNKASQSLLGVLAVARSKS